MFRMKKPSDQTLFFLHIPKCAGTTFTEEIIKRRYSPDELIIFYGHGTQELIKLLQNMSLEEQERIKCIAGHYAYGIHKYYSARSATYITLLRNPVERVISHWFYVLRRKDHYLHQVIAEKNLSLKQYMEEKISIELNNGQTRILAGIGWGAKFGECSQQMLAQAKKNLDTFEVVGISKKFDAFLKLIKRKFAWEIPLFKSRNIAPNHLKEKALDQETIATIKQYNTLDVELYQYACEIFHQQLKEALQ